MSGIFPAMVLLFVSANAFSAAPPCSVPELAVSSPNGQVSIALCVDGGGPRYSIRHQGERIVDWSSLGWDLKDDAPLRGEFRVLSSSSSVFNETWEQPWGEDRWVENRYNELRARLVEASGAGRRLDLVFRAFDDGIGFRYEVPAQERLRDFVIQEERTEFALTEDAFAWWIPAFVVPDFYEGLYRRTRLSEMPAVHTPLTVETRGRFLSLHEADLTDYAGMALRPRSGSTLVSELAPWADGTKVRTSAPMRSPWRTIQIGLAPGDLLRSHLVLNLNEPNRIADTSWIRPRKYLGIWWGMHIGEYTWGTGPAHGATTANAREYIDFAARLGIPGLLIEGWNVGWDGDWGADGNRFRFSEPAPDFDLRAVAEYARHRGVDIIGHHETAGAVENYERQVDDAFRLYRSLGIRTVKTGYVAGKVEKKEWHYGQYMVRHYRLIEEKAARHGIMLDIHEPIKDTGIRRTFPNVMTREGARGMEYDAWSGEKGNPPEHTTILPFTRGLAGPLDFTPGIFDLTRGSTPSDRVRTTLAKQLALYVVIYSPLHMAADLPRNYEGHPAFRFIHDVPTDWERTVPLESRIGDYAVIARKDRNSADWYLGAITDESGRTLSASLDFLDANQSYCAEIYGDRADSHYLANPGAFEIRRRNVRGGERLEILLAPGGGQAIRFAPGGC